MIRSLPRLGCAPGSSCCADCASHRLGEVQEAGDVSTALWVTLAAIVGGFLLAAGAGGKVKFR
jgi:hypothetical protein